MSEDRNVNEGSPEEARAEQAAGEPAAQQPAAAAAPAYGHQFPAQPARSRVRFGKVIRSSAVHLAGAGLIGGLIGGGVVALADHDDRGGRPSFSRTVRDQQPGNLGNGFGGRRQNQQGQQGQQGQGRQGETPATAIPG